jgi:hypothetical protein
MKATLEYTLPEEADDHRYALSGVDALLAIDDIANEIRNFLNHGCGELKEYRDDDGIPHRCCYDTLEAVADFIYKIKQERNLPELY